MGVSERYNDDGSSKWLARTRGPDGVEYSKTHRTKKAGDDWVADERAKNRRGEFVDKKRGKDQLATLWPAFWLKKRTEKDPEGEAYASLWRSRVEPVFGRTPVGRITEDSIQAWVQDMKDENLGTSRILHAHGTLAQMLAIAKRNKMISDNPTEFVELPRLHAEDPRALTSEQVHELACAMPLWSDHIYFLAATGLRMGEFSGARIRDVDLTPGKENIRITQSNVENRGVGKPKTGQSRTVRLHAHIVPTVRKRMKGRKRDAPLFMGPRENGEPVRGSSLRGAMAAATSARVDEVTGVEVPALFLDFDSVTPKDLRSTAASLAIQAGASVTLVSNMLGHRNAYITLTRYAAWFKEDQDALIEALNKVWAPIVL